MKIEMFQDRRRKWRFRLVASNGRILASSEGYSARNKCRDTVQEIQFAGLEGIVGIEPGRDTTLPKKTKFGDNALYRAK